jgi:hypothetical protein
MSRQVVVCWIHPQMAGVEAKSWDGSVGASLPEADVSQCIWGDCWNEAIYFDAENFGYCILHEREVRELWLQP